MSITISTYYLTSSRAGEADYYAPRRRGTIDVWHDSHRWVYSQPRGVSARTVRAAILSAWEQGSRGEYRITGRWPSYRVESVG